MTETATTIVNRALRRVGDRRIEDIDDPRPTAQFARDIYTQERDAALQTHIWNFAVARAELVALASATVPAFEYAYAWALPTDWLRTISVHDSDAGGEGIQYKMETAQVLTTWTRCIATHSNAVWLRYIRQVTDCDLMTPMFRDVLSLRIAVIMASGLAESRTSAADLRTELRAKYAAAASADGIEDFPETMPIGSWARSRYRYAWASRSPWM